MLSRRQVSQQLVALLAGAGVLGSVGSVVESPLEAESFLADGLAFPLASVSTLAAQVDLEVPGRYELVRYRVSVCGGVVTEKRISSNVGSGGSGSSQHSAEAAIVGLLAALCPTPAWSFTETVHGFQGEVESVSPERIVTRNGAFYAVADFTVVVYDCQRADLALATTVAAGSNGAALPQATVNVASTAGFPTKGAVLVTTNQGAQLLTYTGITAGSFTGCTGGTGTMATGGAVTTT